MNATDRLWEAFLAILGNQSQELSPKGAVERAMALAIEAVARAQEMIPAEIPSPDDSRKQSLQRALDEVREQLRAQSLSAVGGVAGVVATCNMAAAIRIAKLEREVTTQQRLMGVLKKHVDERHAVRSCSDCAHLTTQAEVAPCATCIAPERVHFTPRTHSPSVASGNADACMTGECAHQSAEPVGYIMPQSAADHCGYLSETSEGEHTVPIYLAPPPADARVKELEVQLTERTAALAAADGVPKAWADRAHAAESRLRAWEKWAHDRSMEVMTKQAADGTWDIWPLDSAPILIPSRAPSPPAAPGDASELQRALKEARRQTDAALSQREAAWAERDAMKAELAARPVAVPPTVATVVEAARRADDAECYRAISALETAPPVRCVSGWLWLERGLLESAPITVHRHQVPNSVAATVCWHAPASKDPAQPTGHESEQHPIHAGGQRRY